MTDPTPKPIIPQDPEPTLGGGVVDTDPRPEPMTDDPDPSPVD